MHPLRILPAKLGPHFRLPHWNGRRFPLTLAAAILIHTLLLTAVTPAQQLLFPDLIAWERDQDLMHNWVIDTERQPGNWLLRFSVAIPNIGDGPFEVFEYSCEPNSPCLVDTPGTQDIYQNIFDDQGNKFAQFIGNFPEANTMFGHLSLPALAQYNLRDVAGTNGVGDVLATNAKTSLCVVDSISYVGPLQPRNCLSCGSPSSDGIEDPNTGVPDVLGVSVGWDDRYSIALEHQWIDITGVSDGTYWLEMAVDPNDRVIELDNSNNM